MERLKQELLACLGEEGLKLHEMMKEHTTFRILFSRKAQRNCALLLKFCIDMKCLFW